MALWGVSKPERTNTPSPKAVCADLLTGRAEQLRLRQGALEVTARDA